MLTVNQAAKQLGVTPQRVRAMIHAGRLKAEFVGDIYLIKSHELRKVEHRKPGRPRK
jgi:excisionase family DNA binding protein